MTVTTTMVVPMDQTREVQMAEMCGLIWNSDSHGADATDKSGNPFEFKSTSTNKEFSTARDLNLSTIERYMNSFWVFAFYNGKGDDVVNRMYICHPDALKSKFEAWLTKMRDAKFYCDHIWEYASRSMTADKLPQKFIAHYQTEINKIFNRGGQTLPSPSLPKGLIYRSVEVELGTKLDLYGDIPSQVALFVESNPLKVRRPKVL